MPPVSEPAVQNGAAQATVAASNGPLTGLHSFAAAGLARHAAAIRSAWLRQNRDSYR